MTTAEFDLLKAHYPEAELKEEDGRPVVLLPKLKILTKTSVETRTGLLIPWEHSNYPTRLFIDQKVSCSGNWQQQYLTTPNQAWWGLSWSNIAATNSWLNILYGHLRAFQDVPNG